VQKGPKGLQAANVTKI